MGYKNPTPHLGGKKFMLRMVFDFEDWTEIDEAKGGIEHYIIENGVPKGCVSDITPHKEYYEEVKQNDRL